MNKVFAVLIAALSLVTAAAFAQSYPDKPVKLIVPFPPGGPTDGMARIIGQKLAETWKQSVVIDNRGGAGGGIAAEAASKAPADGYTVFFATTGTQAINPSLYEKLPYDPIKDFAPISLVATTANILVVNPSLPVKTVKELIAYAKANPGKLTFGSAGNGSSNHLAGELFNTMAGVNMTHVPYKGSAAALNDLLGGQLSMMWDVLSTAMPHVATGKTRPLGVTSLKRSAIAPEVPTIDESGLPGYEVTLWFGVLAPSATPRVIVDKINADLKTILATPDMKERLAKLGAAPAYTTPEQFEALEKSDIAKWSKVVKASGAKVD